ncbi:MAG TPA: thioredoxin family protein [Dehalococcoidia bacterium]
MAVQRESVVTPERFAQGLTWAQWMEQIERNRDRFQQNYDRTELTEEQAAAFRELVARPDGPGKVLALGEDWCPDVYRGLPVMARIAEAAGLELRIFFRDQNKDIMNEFLNQGQFESIPTFVFYTKDHRYIAHWIERPKIANEQMGEVRKLMEGKSREEARDVYFRWQDTSPVWAGWRQATITEILELLREHTG